MMETFELTNYNFYSNRHEMELVSTIVDSLKNSFSKAFINRIDNVIEFNRLKENGINKYELGREGFLQEAWKWKNEYAEKSNFIF